MACIFAICQSICPLVGAFLGDTFRYVIESVDHWVAFLLLATVGGKMILDAVRNKAGNEHDTHSHLSVAAMFVLGIATSIDSLAVGIGLGLNMMLVDVLKVVALIGGATFLFSLLGTLFGRRRIRIPQRTANFVAGLVLILLGLKILLEHLGLLG